MTNIGPFDRELARSQYVKQLRSSHFILVRIKEYGTKYTKISIVIIIVTSTRNNLSFQSLWKCYEYTLVKRTL